MTEQDKTRPKRKNHEGTFRQLPSGRYEGAKWVKEIGRTVSVTADTEAKARKALNEKVALVSNHQLPARRAKVTFLEYAEGVIAERTKIGQRTRDKYTGDLKLYLKPLHHLRLDDIKPHTLRKLYAGLRAKGLSDTICIHAHVLIRLVLERARTDKIIAVNPADEQDVRPGRERGSRSERAARSFTPVEAARLLEFAPKVLHGEVVAFLLLTGMRRGEAMALRWENVDFELSEVRVTSTRSISGSKVYEGTPKTDASYRDIRLASEAVTLLRHVQQLNGERRQALYPESPESHYVFPSTHGTPQRPDNVRRTLHQIYDCIDADNMAQEEARARAEGREVKPPRPFRRLPVHSLRHTFVSVMAARGEKLEDIALWIGDRPATVLAVYLHVFGKGKRVPSMGVGTFTAAPEGPAGRAGRASDPGEA